MFPRTIILSLAVFCFTYTVSVPAPQDLPVPAPRDIEITCAFGYRVRNETAQGVTEGMCTIVNTVDDHVCHGCTREVPKGVKCVDNPGDVPMEQLKNSQYSTTCPNYESLFLNGEFIGFGCADAKKPQKARCLDIEHQTTCPPNSCR